jgi:hypothetical protein
VGSKPTYEFNPTGMDAYDPKPHHPKPGAHVVLSNQSGVGRVKGSQRYVEDATSGQFHGMVNTSSLSRVTKKRPVIESDPQTKARVNSVFHDRSK